MRTHISYWLRAFRTPLERAYPCTDEVTLELEDLLRQADQRTVQSEQSTDNHDPQTQH